MVNNKRVDVVKNITKYIQGRGVVFAVKTKSRFNGGQHKLTVGPYRTAVPGETHYAIISQGKAPEANWTLKFNTAREAAKEFVAFCGNDIAATALSQAIVRNR